MKMITRTDDRLFRRVSRRSFLRGELAGLLDFFGSLRIVGGCPPLHVAVFSRSRTQDDTDHPEGIQSNRRQSTRF